MNKFTISIDWEDFGQLYCKYLQGSITKPLQDIDRQTNIILELLDKNNVKGTFFVLGILAKYKPELVRKIQKQGHEIALHGQNHTAMFSLSRKEQEKDVSDNYKIVSDIIGEKIYGYRAPFFSLNKSNLFLLEILSELGLEYDSSIFPTKLPKYGIANFNQENKLYKLPNNKEIVELPLTLLNFKNKKLPVSGGGYIRLMPFWLTKNVFKRLDNSDLSTMIYMHPYEFDSNKIDISSNFPTGFKYTKIKKKLLNLRWNLFRKSIIKKIDYSLQNFEFVTCKEKSDYVKNTTHSPTILGR